MNPEGLKYQESQFLGWLTYLPQIRYIFATVIAANVPAIIDLGFIYFASLRGTAIDKGHIFIAADVATVIDLPGWKIRGTGVINLLLGKLGRFRARSWPRLTWQDVEDMVTLTKRLFL